MQTLKIDTLKAMRNLAWQALDCSRAATKHFISLFESKMTAEFERWVSLEGARMPRRFAARDERAHSTLVKHVYYLEREKMPH